MFVVTERLQGAGARQYITVKLARDNLVCTLGNASRSTIQCPNTNKVAQWTPLKGTFDHVSWLKIINNGLDNCYIQCIPSHCSFRFLRVKIFRSGENDTNI